MVRCVKSHLDMGMGLPAFSNNDFSMYTHAFCTNESVVGMTWSKSKQYHYLVAPSVHATVPLRSRDMAEDEVYTTVNKRAFDEVPREDESQAYAASKFKGAE